LVLAGTAILAILAMALWPQPEPFYQGLSLSTWIEKHAKAGDDVAGPHDAISSVGTNAIPFLLKWMHYEPTPLRLVMMRAANYLPFNRHINSALLQPYTRAERATYAFAALRSSASNAVPTLIGMLTNSAELETASRASSALAWIGEPGLPTLVEVISDDQLTNRELAVFSVAHMRNPGTNGLPAVPVLMRALDSPNSRLRRAALHALGNLALEPQIVVPALIRMLEDPDPEMRWQAAYTLGEFHEQAKCAVPALLRVRQSSSRDVIDKALARIDPESIRNPDENRVE
jgi:hypothetical protein